MITTHYEDLSKTIKNVAEYIKKESLSNEPYKGNILTATTDKLDSVSPI